MNSIESKLANDLSSINPKWILCPRTFNNTGKKRTNVKKTIVFGLNSDKSLVESFLEHCSLLKLDVWRYCVNRIIFLNEGKRIERPILMILTSVTMMYARC